MNARQEAIQRLLSDAPVATQQELRQKLAVEGSVVTQTTLSRDLARRGAGRVSRPGGRSRYAFDGLRALGATAVELGDLVLGVRHNRDLVVVHTRPGAASAIAR